MADSVDTDEFAPKDLILMAQAGNEEAANTLVSLNLPLVKSIAKKYVRWDTDFDDLCQIGAVGLIKAINRFDFSYNVKFSTYAVSLIIGEIKRHLRDDGMIKVSRALKSLAAAAAAASDKLSGKLGRSAHISEVAEYLKVSEEELNCALDAVTPYKSLSERVFDDSTQCCEDMMGDGFRCEESMLERVQIRRFISILSDREKRIVLLRYFRGMTQSEIATVMGVSQVQISRIEHGAIERMKRLAEE